MSSQNVRRRLRGRHSECEALDLLVASVRAGRSAVFVLRGEAGIGKTELLDYLADRSSGFRIARASGVESEMELPFAGLHQLCGPFLDRAERLPPPQREALGTAFGLSAAPAPDRFMVGLAALSLLAELAGEQPLLCLIDDAQWLDRVSAQTLAFVARRLLAEPIALVFAVREPVDQQEFAGFPEMVVGGLNDRDAGALLDSTIPGRLDGHIRSRIIAETRGNPLALLELAQGMAAAELAGGFGLPDTRPLASQIEQSFLQRVRMLPPATQRLLLTAAADPMGDVTLLMRAAERIGLDLSAATPAEAAGLIDIGVRVRFRHPLIRSAVYRSSSVDDRQEAHRALAEVTDPAVDPDRRAWHLAQATSGTNEAVAAELESSASRAQSRGGLAATAAFLERAALLTPEPSRRSLRSIAAADAKLRAGAPEAALALLVLAERGPLDDLQGARLELLRAETVFASSHGNDAPALLLTAARRLEQLDAGLAHDTYLDAISAAMFAGRLARGGADVVTAAQAARAAPMPPNPDQGDMLLRGLAVLFTDGYRAAVPVLRRALERLYSEDLSADDGLRWLWLAAATAADLWDDEGWHLLASRHVQLAREAGALTELPLALNSRVFVHLFAGELEAAAALMAEVPAFEVATGSDLAPYGALGLAAWQRGEAEARDLIDASMNDVVARGEGVGLTVSHWASALLYNSLGKHHEALAAAVQAGAHPQELAVANWGLTELIEAAARTGDTEVAADALERLSAMTHASGTAWALGIEARARALLSNGPAAETLYREAIETLGATRVRVELARAHLLYGEWLQRENRRIDAVRQLRTAHDMLREFGAGAFVERAARGLQASGVTVSGRAAAEREPLTPQEAQIARLASDGLTNPEIGAQLFLSPHTVDWHLRKVFAKLGVKSRKRLRERLPASATTAATA